MHEDVWIEDRLGAIPDEAERPGLAAVEAEGVVSDVLHLTLRPFRFGDQIIEQ